MGTSSALALLVRRRRLELRLTQREAAERAGVSLATWQSLERHTVDARDFQDLTLARAAHGLDLADAEVLEVAGRSRRASARDPGAAHRIVETATDASPQRLVSELGAVLLELARHSEADFLLVYGQTIELTDHLLMRHDGGSAAG